MIKDRIIKIKDIGQSAELRKTDASLYSPPHTRNWSEICMNTDVSVETLRRALTQLQETLDGTISQTVLRRMQRHAVDVTLDSNTANPRLTLSDDRKQVTHGAINRDSTDDPQRFDYCSCVLGTEGFSSGMFYFEVDVTGSSEWDLGVARESVDRKGLITATPDNGYYTVALRNKNDYCAFADPPVSLLLRVKPQIVGVFVHYEEGLVSFYDVGSRSHIYSFTDQTFAEKLYPFFCPDGKTEGKVSAPLIISPVNHI
ncbi:E3 ubiquitin- ligase TRIM39-like protein [Labeo rohita]|uniref:E3 ubiquitin-ligase TRIM39-like protein n=1 Tax=Labeo rohita TaxID=84645 RepID=A0A498NCY3_LABRO|nr:E3 ubiquitin- ligase TRIM39-like protein [Labeo rohita]